MLNKLFFFFSKQREDQKEADVSRKITENKAEEATKSHQAIPSNENNLNSLENIEINNSQANNVEELNNENEAIGKEMEEKENN